MVSAVGSSAFPSTAGRSVAALEGQIRQDKIQLNDWTTCVSSKTPKGQAAIQKLSGEISADKEQIARAQQADSAVPPVAPGASDAGARGVKAAASLVPSASDRPGSVDLWA